MREEKLEWVSFGDQEVNVWTLREHAADFYMKYGQWPIYLCHARSYLDVNRWAADARVFYNRVNTLYGPGLMIGDATIVPSRQVEERGKFIARPPEQEEGG